MITKLGICSVIAGLFVGLFAGISSFMADKTFWVDLTISKIIGEDNAESIIMSIDSVAVQNFLDSFIYELPFFLFLIGLGVVSLVIGMFVKDH
ncbi:MAG: hypothetical protein GY699_14415 [Desulfobacteraceae bacterium]|nr:hypothetical protein [Desulfobacteraceae bacterium]